MNVRHPSIGFTKRQTSFGLCLIAAVILAACAEKPSPQPAADAVSDYTGSASCATCHEDQVDAWTGSHHQLAMQTANADTVLGDFSGIEFDYFDTTSRFEEDGSTFVVRTQNALGEEDAYPVAYTFGIEPLQQYLVEFPGGRLQALPFAWDTRAEDEGGQQWFHLYPDEHIAPGDELHWTGINFNWNYMCAECHSTDVQLGYDLESDSFETTYTEISIGCEACHGPGRLHVEQAQAYTFDENYGLELSLDDKGGSAWVINPDTGIAKRSVESKLPTRQVEACGRCHARRAVTAPDYVYGKPLADTHSISLLYEHLYFPDGQILEEVYVYGSFVQSKMYRAGVTCSDCHDPHSTKLRTGPDPDVVCAQCHLPAVFDSDDHHGSDESCVDCHMRSRTYMINDGRRDHSFRIPTESVSSPHYGDAIQAGREGNANSELSAAIGNGDFPAIARATMLTLLTAPLDDQAVATLRQGLADPDPLVRIGALRQLRQQPAATLMQEGIELLNDEIRSVRIEAAHTFVEVRDLFASSDNQAFNAAAEDLRQSMLFAASRPESLLVLADFEHRAGNDSDGGDLLRLGVKNHPAHATLRHAFGLYLVRAGRHEEALVQISQANRLDPENQRFAYVYGVALYSLGEHDKALELATGLADKYPDDEEIRGLLDALTN